MLDSVRVLGRVPIRRCAGACPSTEGDEFFACTAFFFWFPADVGRECAWRGDTIRGGRRLKTTTTSNCAWRGNRIGSCRRFAHDCMKISRGGGLRLARQDTTSSEGQVFLGFATEMKRRRQVFLRIAW